MAVEKNPLLANQTIFHGLCKKMQKQVYGRATNFARQFFFTHCHSRALCFLMHFLTATTMENY